jgi:hypothetical protein
MRYFVGSGPARPARHDTHRGRLFGNQICIGVSGPRCGHVYFWDHEHEDEDEPTYGNMHLVARSFSELLTTLT